MHARVLLSVLVALLLPWSAFGAGWTGDVAGLRPLQTLSLDPSGIREAFYTFTNGDGTTLFAETLDTTKCDRIDTANMFLSATAAIWTHESAYAPGTVVPRSSLLILTSDFDNDGVSDVIAQDASTPELSGLRNFMASGIVVTIETACSTGTCAVKVQCGGAIR